MLLGEEGGLGIGGKMHTYWKMLGGLGGQMFEGFSYVMHYIWNHNPLVRHL